MPKLFKYRLLKIVEYSKQDLTTFGRGFVSIGIENIRRLSKNESANPSLPFLNELLTRYPDISARWLITGDGGMLEGFVGDDIDEPCAGSKKRDPDLIKAWKECGALEYEVKQLKEKISELEAGGSGREMDEPEARAG